MRSKVIDSARSLGLELNVQRVPGASASAAATAAAVGCDCDRLASCAVFVADGDPVVCIASTVSLVDLDLLAEALDVAELRPASDSEVRASTGFSATAVPPFGHGLPVVLDQGLLSHTTVWATGGDGHTLVEVETTRLASCTAATVAAITAVVA